MGRPWGVARGVSRRAGDVDAHLIRARLQVHRAGRDRSTDILHRLELVRLRDPGYAPYRQAKAKRKKTRQLRVLQSLPGVGADRAKKLLEHFGTGRAWLP